MSPFNLGLFSGPRYSSFPWSHDNKTSMRAGAITPIAWDFLNTGDKIEASVADIVRLAPMVAPTLDTYKIDIHAFALRLRSLGNATRDPWSYEDFFNLNKNTDGSKMLPSIPVGFLLAVNGFRNGTLIEHLGFPTFKKDREQYLEYLRNNCSYVFDPIITLTNVSGSGSGTTLDVTGFYPASMPQKETDGSSINVNYNEVDFSELRKLYYLERGESSPVAYYTQFKAGGSAIAGAEAAYLPYVGTLVSYIAQTYPAVFSENGSSTDLYIDSFGASTLNASYDFSNGIPKWIAELNGTNLLDKVYEKYKISSIAVMKDFEDWLLDGFLSLTSDGIIDTSSSYYYIYRFANNSVFAYFLNVLNTYFDNLPYWNSSDPYKSRLIPAYPFDTYYKIISDWYINTAIDDPDTFFTGRSFYSLFKRAVNQEIGYYTLLTQYSIMNQLFNRFWANDYFTSAFPSPQAGTAVGIPVNGTIVDLRNANAMQKLKERLLYAGSRFRDVLFAITGKKTSAAILEMSEVLGSWSNVINVDSVLQQSSSQNGSPQAGYAGTGLGYRSGGKDFKYSAEEPTIIMVFASIRPQASYFQGMPRKFVRSNVYDYAIPQLANVGEQEINVGELYLGSGLHSGSITPSDGFNVFGYTRRNGDWMWTPNEVHGDFRGSLDFWHNARIFGSVPSLSRSFLQVNPDTDNLNRVFAVDSDSYDHFYCNFSFTGHIIRSLPKHVHYDL